MRSLRSLRPQFARGSIHTAPDRAALKSLEEVNSEVRDRLHNVSAIMTGNWSSSEFTNVSQSHLGGRKAAAAEGAAGRTRSSALTPPAAGLGTSSNFSLHNFLDGGAEAGEDPVASFVEVSAGVRVALGAAASVTGGVGAGARVRTGTRGMPVVFSPTTQCVMCSYILEQADRKIKEIPRWSNGGGYFPGTSNFAPGTQRGYYRNYAETTAMLELGAEEQQHGRARASDRGRRARMSVGAGVRAGATQGRSTRTSTGHYFRGGGLTASAFGGGAGVASASGLASTGGGIGRGGVGGMGGMGLGSLAMASRGFSMAGGRNSASGSAGGVVGSGSPIPMDPVEERVMQALAIRQNPEGHPEAARRAADEVLHRIFMGTGVTLGPGDHVIVDDSSKSVFDDGDDNDNNDNATSQGDGGTSAERTSANLVAEMIRNSKLRRRHRALSMAYADIDRIDNTVEASTEYTQMFQDFMDAIDYIQEHDLPPDYQKYARLIYRNANAVVEYYLHDYEDWQICSAIYACSDGWYDTETAAIDSTP